MLEASGCSSISTELPALRLPQISAVCTSPSSDSAVNLQKATLKRQVLKGYRALGG